MANSLLIFDVGGTFIRALHVQNGEKKGLFKVPHGTFPSFIEWFKNSPFKELKPMGVVIAAAGPKEMRGIQMTNLSWFFNLSDVKRFFNCPVRLLNDLEAAVHLLPSAGDFIPLQGAPQLGTKGLIVPGTGLGEAFIIPHNGEWIPVPTESGQTLYTPQLDFGKRSLRIEELLSGPGLSLIHATLTGEKLSPEEVGEKKGEAVLYFLELLLAEAQTFALRTLPFGGLFFGGAMIRSFAPLLQKMGVETFSRHPTMGDMLKKIPLAILPVKDLVLEGAFIAAKEHI